MKYVQGSVIKGGSGVKHKQKVDLFQPEIKYYKKITLTSLCLFYLK